MLRPEGEDRRERPAPVPSPWPVSLTEDPLQDRAVEPEASPVDATAPEWMNELVRRSRVLVVDDEESNLVVLEAILEDAGYDNVLCCSDETQTFDLYASFQPDVVLLDLHMHRVDGISILKGLRALSAGDYLPVLVITGDTTQGSREAALLAGARDFVTKPFTNNELLLRIKNLLETRQLYQTVLKQNQSLESRIEERTRELEQAKIEMMERLARAAEFRDDETGKHTGRVGRLCAQIGEVLGLPKEEVQLLRQAAPLHDVGKIGIPDRILQKPGRLSVDEFQVMKKHTAIGSSLLAGSMSRTLKLAQRIALTHHERWDGRGYAGIQGENIPLSSRIVAVADVFDALTHRRPYKEAWDEDRAVAELAAESGRHFDPLVVNAFMELPTVVDLR